MNETCGCCEGLEPLTPLVIANRPGLNRLAYRAGTHATFLATMKARLSASEYSALAGLTTRVATDPAIALLDAWALVADVLTFYQERIANEGYLRTATERRSILELARLVGYTLRPGVAASVYLAFTLSEHYNLEIPAGTRAQSLPGPGELPQSFETAENLEARATWNNLKPRLSKPQWYTLSDAYQIDTLYFEGVATNLETNDPLLLVFGDGEDQQVLRRVDSVELQATENRTKVTLQAQLDPKKAAFVGAVLETVNSHLDVSPEGVMAREVRDILTRLQDGAKRDEPPERLADLVQEESARLREYHSRAESSGFGNLEPWLKTMVDELEEAVSMLPTRGTGVTAR